MQDLLADILPWIAGFFLYELVVSIGRHHFYFVATWRWRSTGKGLNLLPPAPGLEVIAAHAFPLLVGRDGLWLPDPRRPYSPRVLLREDLRYVPFDRMGRVFREHRSVIAGKDLLLVAPTKAIAEAIAAHLEALRAMPADKRVSAHDRHLHEATDLDRLRRLERIRSAFVPWISAVAWLFLLLLFVVSWQVYLKPTHQLNLARILLIGAMLMLLNACLGAILLKRMGQSVGSIAGSVAQLWMPFSALHPLLHLSRNLYANFHASALSAVLLPRADLRTRARQELHRLAQCSAKSDDRALAEAWERESACWKRVLARLGERVKELLDEPPLAVGSEDVYCPVCSAAYRKGVGQCVDCGIALRGATRKP